MYHSIGMSKFSQLAIWHCLYFSLGSINSIKSICELYSGQRLGKMTQNCTLFLSLKLIYAYLGGVTDSTIQCSNRKMLLFVCCWLKVYFWLISKGKYSRENWEVACRTGYLQLSTAAQSGYFALGRTSEYQTCPNALPFRFAAALTGFLSNP